MMTLCKKADLTSLSLTPCWVVSVCLQPRTEKKMEAFSEGDVTPIWNHQRPASLDREEVDAKLDLQGFRGE